MCRRELYFWCALIAVANVMVRYIAISFSLFGVLGAFTTTFNVSAIIWTLLIWSLLLLRPTKQVGVLAGRLDYFACFVVIALSSIPLEYIGWIAVLIAGFSAYFRAEGDLDQRKAGILLAGVTVPMFWTKLIFSIFSRYILVWDAMLVAQITQTERTGNLVAMPGNDGFLQILGPCSSFSNISLAYAGWLAVLCYYDLRKSTRLLFWCAVVIVSIVAVNTIRIALIGFFPAYHHLIHDEVGSTIVGWIYVAVIFGISSWAARTEPRQVVDPSGSSRRSVVSVGVR